jgi:alpha-mannosidase
MALDAAQRREWLRVRVDELRWWVHRAWMDLEDWTWDGQAIALGAPWPERSGVRVVHGRVSPPAEWETRRLLLDVGGEGLVRLTYADGARERFGLDAEHREFPLRAQPFELEVEAVARLAFGAPNREARLAAARVVWVDVELEALVRRLDLVWEAAEELDGHEACVGLVEAAARALARLRWPSATGPYLARQAQTRQMRSL